MRNILAATYKLYIDMRLFLCILMILINTFDGVSLCYVYICKSSDFIHQIKAISSQTVIFKLKILKVIFS